MLRFPFFPLLHCTINSSSPLGEKHVVRSVCGLKLKFCIDGSGMDKPAVYRIKVKVVLPDGGLDRLGGLQVTAKSIECVTLEGHLPDQAALAGVLQRAKHWRFCGCRYHWRKSRPTHGSTRRQPPVRCPWRSAPVR